MEINNSSATKAVDLKNSDENQLPLPLVYTNKENDYKISLTSKHEILETSIESLKRKHNQDRIYKSLALYYR